MLSAPATFLIFLMILGPAGAVVVICMSDWEFGSSTFSFVGTENFRALLDDRVFWKSLTNTLIYVAVVVLVSVVLGLVAAVMIESCTFFRSFYRAVYFLPVMATMAAIAVAWQMVLHPQIGLLNQGIRAIGMDFTMSWLQNEKTVLATLCVIGIWQAVGFNMILFLAGLTSIPNDLYEAAEVDGADSAWDRFNTVTWPLLGPTSIFVLVITAIRAFQVFDTVAVLTRGGPNKASEVMLYTIYNEAFVFFRTGHAATLTIVYLAIILTLTLVQVWFLDKRVHYT
ncbi:MAG: sugar ABC transporter permease [Thermodesulfobacteriota bacterium]|nr:sugar ABC transporter permease [Thermodesulfobacteriota bacterium]